MSNNIHNNHESSLVNAAIHILSTTRTNSVETIYAESPVTIVIDRVEWEKWFLDEQTRTFCTFYNRTGGNARVKNTIFIEKFSSHAQPHTALRNPAHTSEQQDNNGLLHAGTKRGHKSTINFNEVWYCHRAGVPRQSIRNPGQTLLPCNCAAKVVFRCEENNPLKM
ncbi:hypothetical protein INT45_004559 [Circinella minor]|uniref:Uncharacterized protein n=1 Tax=Circinella minor TaxID=1195481 RepID=A0A8H7RCT6_9FUNG|nr:hypothetical protein INT45_004559 [Circinella minor]